MTWCAGLSPFIYSKTRFLNNSHERLSLRPALFFEHLPAHGPHVDFTGRDGFKGGIVQRLHDAGCPALQLLAGDALPVLDRLPAAIQAMAAGNGR